MSLPKYEFDTLRIRVERLLRGDSNPDDLLALFLALRDYSGGRECVVEIGNFIAHRGERKIGIVTRESRDLFALIRFHFPQPKPPLDLTNLPSNFSDVLAAAFRKTGNDILRLELRLKRQHVEKQLTRLRDRVQRHTDGKFFLAWPTNDDVWPAPGSEDTELGVLMGPEVAHGEAEVYTRVQA
jgi:hypothetical protein